MPVSPGAPQPLQPLQPLRPVPVGATDPSADALMRRAAAENPRAAALLPVILHTIGRGLQRHGAAPQSDLDLLFDNVMARHPGAATDALRSFVDGYAALPATTRAALEPTPLRSLNVGQPLATRTVLQGLHAVTVTVPARGNLQPAVGDSVVRSGTVDWQKLSTQPMGQQLSQRPVQWLPPRDAASYFARFFDPVPSIKTIEITGTYEEGATLTLRGSRFATDPGGTTFVVSQQAAGGQFQVIGPVAASSLTGSKAVIALPALFGKLVPDTDPPVTFQVKAVRSAAVNSLQGKPTESKVLTFSVPHRMKAERPAIVAGPTIRSISATGVHSGQSLLVQVDNLGAARVIDNGLHANQPAVAGAWYSENVSGLQAFLTRQDGLDSDPWGSSVNCKLVKPSGQDGSPAQVQVFIPQGQWPGDYFLQLTFSPGILPTPINFQGASAKSGVASDEQPLQVLPYHFTGRFTKLQLVCVGGQDASTHNLNTFNVFTVIGNGIAYSGSSGVSRIDLKSYGQPSDPQLFSTQEGAILQDANGGPVAMYGPLAVGMAAYNFTPGSDNQKTLDAIKTGSAIAAEVAVGVAGVFGGAEAAEVAQEVADDVKKVLDWALGFFHKTSPAKISLDTSGTTTIDYVDLIKASQDQATGHVGTIPVPMGQTPAFNAIVDFTGEFKWRRDEQ